MTMKRRDALKTIGGLGAAAGLSRFLPGCGNNGPTGITTYVYMMMENRSYDHYFGARKLIEDLPGEGLRADFTNPDLKNQRVPIFEPNVDQMCDLDPPHNWDASHAQWNRGACDGFVQQQQITHENTDISPMQYLTRTQLPVSWALADAYTTCDHWFASVMGPTWPNRFYWHTGSSGGMRDNDLPSSGLTLTWPSVYNRLQEAGVDWAYYYGWLPAISLLNSKDSPYYLPEDYILPRVRGFSTFISDAMAGQLPPVVYIDPALFINDDHPPVHPINGQELIAAVYTALANSPHWNNCMLVITYDEHGGFFDHVSPPRTEDDYAAMGFDQLGFRVPALVIGPYVKQGYVSSVVYDHTSAIKHLQNTFGLHPLTKRSEAATDLTDCIDMDLLAKGTPNPPIELPEIDLSQWPMNPQMCKPAGSFLVEPDPFSAWADANPERIAGLDLRPQLPQYRKAIRDFLAQSRKVRVPR
jgi:phospholipase C